PRRRDGRSTDEELIRAAAAQGTTGRFIVIFREGASKTATQTLRNRAGVSMATTADVESGAPPEDLGDQGLTFDKLDMAVVDMAPAQTRGVAAATEDEAIELVVPEGIKLAAV